MNYAAAVVTGRAPAAPRPQVQEATKVTAPEPQTQEPVQSPQPKVQDVVVVKYVGNNGGEFSIFTQPIFNALALFLDPLSLISLGSTCHTLKTALLNANTWTQSQVPYLPKTFKPVFRVEFQVPVRGPKDDEESGFDEEDLDTDTTVEKGTAVVTSAFFRREARKQQLEKVWKYQISKVQRARDKKFDDESKREKDPLIDSKTDKKPALDVKLPGGLVLGFREGTKKSEKPVEKFFVRSKDISDTLTWLEAVNSLLRGEKPFVDITVQTSTLRLSRYGRGGSMVIAKVKSAPEKYYFQLSDIVLQIRYAIKDLLPIFSRVYTLLKQEGKNVQDKEESDSNIEIEKFFENAFHFAKLQNLVRTIKQSLEAGAIPNSDVKKILQKKREKKRNTQSQVEKENGHILDFIYANLPADLDQVRAQASRQAEEAKAAFELARENAKAERQRKYEEQRRAQDAIYKAKQEAREARKAKAEGKEEEEEGDKPLKTKTKAVKTVGEDGFVTLDTTFTKVDKGGKVVEEVAASKNVLAKQEEQAKEKQSKAKTSSVQTLQNNSFALVSQAAGLESAAQIQAKLNLKKGAQRNAENNEKQGAAKIAPPKAPPKKEEKKKPKVPKAKKAKKEEEPEELAIRPGINTQPIIVAALAVAVAVLSYVFLLS